MDPIRSSTGAVTSAARVTTRDGVEVAVDPLFAQPDMTRLRLGDDVSVVLPANLLHRQADGTIQIPLTAAELSAAAGREAVIPVVEEKVSVSKQEHETGRVVVHVTPHLRDEQVNVELAEEHVEIERVPINEFIPGPVSVRQEGDVTVVPVVEEVLVVEKRLMLREEIRLTRQRQMRRHVEQVTLRTEEAHILRADNSKNAAG